MSKNNPIPVRLRDKFKSHMDANNFDEMPDGAWFFTLENAAEEFIERHHLKFADSNNAAHQYLRMLKDESL